MLEQCANTHLCLWGAEVGKQPCHVFLRPRRGRLDKASGPPACQDVQGCSPAWALLFGERQAAVQGFDMSPGLLPASNSAQALEQQRIELDLHAGGRGEGYCGASSSSTIYAGSALSRTQIGCRISTQLEPLQAAACL